MVPAIDWRFYIHRKSVNCALHSIREQTRTAGRSYGLGDGGERVRFCLPERWVRNDGERMSTSILFDQEVVCCAAAVGRLLVVECKFTCARCRWTLLYEQR